MIRRTMLIVCAVLGLATPLAGASAQALVPQPQSSTPASALPQGPAPSNAPQQSPTSVEGPATAPAQFPADPSYVLGAGDVVEVSVLGTSDYSARVQIQSDGTILLPFINSVQAAKHTVLQLRDAIAAKLKAGGYYTNPAVNVTVASFASHYVTVLGQVRNPGIVPIDRAYHLSEIIARAGGVTNPAISEVTVTGKDGQSRQLDLGQVATGGADPLINDGEKIYIAPAKTFYIYGQVSAPGTYPIQGNMTIRMALARSGGLTAMGSSKRIKLVRNQVEKKADLAEPVQPDDVIVVGERFF